MKARVLNAPGYPARIPKPRRAGLYKLGSTTDMGKGLFAARDVKRGELILAERPLILEIKEPPGAVINQTTINQQILEEYESLLETAFARLSLENQDAFKALHRNLDALENFKTSSEYENFLEATGLPPMSRDEFKALQATQSTNELFRISRTNRYGAFGLLNDGEKEAKFSVVCKIASRINHRCGSSFLSRQAYLNYSLSAVRPTCYTTPSSALSLFSSMRYVTSRPENNFFLLTATPTRSALNDERGSHYITSFASAPLVSTPPLKPTD
jgi:hypothetical protein